MQKTKSNTQTQIFKSKHKRASPYKEQSSFLRLFFKYSEHKKKTVRFSIKEKEKRIDIFTKDTHKNTYTWTHSKVEIYIQDLFPLSHFKV